MRHDYAHCSVNSDHPIEFIDQWEEAFRSDVLKEIVSLRMIKIPIREWNTYYAIESHVRPDILANIRVDPFIEALIPRLLELRPAPEVQSTSHVSSNRSCGRRCLSALQDNEHVLAFATSEGFTYNLPPPTG